MSKKDLGKIFLFSKDYDFSQIGDGIGTSYSDGSGYYEGNDGTKIQIYSDGSGYYEGADGSTGQIYSDGSGFFDGNNGSKGQKYSDGSGYYESSNGDIENYYSEDDYEEEDNAFNIGAKIGEGLAGALYGFASSTRNQSKANESYNKIKTEKDKKNDNIFICLYMVFMLLALAFCLFMAYWYSTPKAGEVKVTIDPKSYIGVNYQEVEEKFEDMGFTNIKSVPKEDLITGWINKEGETDKITINNDSFKKDEIFSEDAEVVITYHSFKEK